MGSKSLLLKCNRFFRKSVCIVLSVSLVTSVTFISSFAEYEESEDGMHGNVSENVYTIVHGTDPDFIVGEGVLLGQDAASSGSSNHPGESTPDFQAGGYDHTHQYIVANAIQILANDFGANVLQEPTNSDLILEGADYPDKHENNWIFLWHFYDPQTEKPYLITATITAKLKSMEYYNSAVEEYKKGNVETAMSYIGRGAHYFSDINEPHHANNLTAVNSNHSAYEKDVDEKRLDYFVEEYSLDDYYYKQAVNMGLNDFIRSHAYVSKSLKGGVTSSVGSADSIKASHACVENAISNVAQYFYRFGVDVGIYNRI